MTTATIPVGWLQKTKIATARATAAIRRAVRYR